MKRKIRFFILNICIPVIFLLLGYCIIRITMNPLFDMLKAYSSMVIYENKSGLKPEIKYSYNNFDMIAQISKIPFVKYPNIKSSINNDLNKGLIASSKTLDKLSIKEIEFPNVGDYFADLSCDKIELFAPIFWGDTNEILKVGVGQSVASFIPGLNKTLLLSGHNTTYLKALQNITIGDVITYSTHYGNYQYKVNDIQVLTEKEALMRLNEWLSYESENLIIYTCYPFKTTLHTKDERFFVFAKKVFGKGITN